MNIKDRIKKYVETKKQTIFIAAAISMVHFIISILIENYIFSKNVYSIIIKLGLRIVFLFVLFFAWFFLVDFMKKIKKKNSFYIRWFKIFICIFIVFTLIMIIIWPGNWIWDEGGILKDAVVFKVSSWQHFLTSLYYIFSLMFLPFPFAIVLIQYSIIAFIISYITAVLTTKYSKVSIIVVIFCLLPPVLLHVFYPMRINLYGFIELLFFFMLYINMKQNKMKNTHIIILSVISVILTVWRTEGIFLVLVLPIIMLMKKYTKKTVLIVFLLTTICSGIMVGIQNYHLVLGYENSVDYNLTGIAAPYHSLIKKEYKENKNGPLVKSAKRYLDFNEINKYTENEGEEAFWGGAYYSVDNDKKLKMMTKDYRTLLIKYPKTFLHNRYQCFLDSQKICDDKGKIVSVVQEGNVYQQVFNLDKYPMGKAINKGIRAKVLNCLYGNSNYKMLNRIVIAMFNLFVPLLLIFIMTIYSIIRIKARRQMLIIMGSLLLHFALVFATAPATYFMYYFPVYICGYILFFTFVISRICKEKTRNE